MIRRPNRKLVWAGAGVGVLVFQVFAHRGTVSASPLSRDAVLAVAPFAALLLWFAWRSRRAGLMLGLWTLLMLVATLSWKAIGAHLEWLYFITHVGINSVLFLTFARSLGPGRLAVCTDLAVVVHGTLSPPVLRYTRRVTLAWATFFGVMSAVSVVLFVVAPIAVWSAFANLLTLPLVALMFVAEYWIRTRVLPPEDCFGVLAGVRAYLQRGTSTGDARLPEPAGESVVRGLPGQSSR